MRLSVFAALSLALAPVSSVVFAQASAVHPGMAVKDSSGGTVGSVIKVDGAVVTIKTDKYDIPLPAQSFTPDGHTLLFGMTQAQINAEWEKGLASAEASLAVGAVVKGPQGAQVGTIESIDAETVVIALSNGKKIQLPRTGIAGSPDGARIGLTSEQIEAQFAS